MLRFINGYGHWLYAAPLSISSHIGSITEISVAMSVEVKYRNTNLLSTNAISSEPQTGALAEQMNLKTNNIVIATYAVLLVLFLAVMAVLGRKLYHKRKTDTNKTGRNRAAATVPSSRAAGAPLGTAFLHNGSISSGSEGSSSSLESINESAAHTSEHHQPVQLSTMTEDGQVRSHDFVMPSEDYTTVPPVYQTGSSCPPHCSTQTSFTFNKNEDYEDFEFISVPMLFKRTPSDLAAQRALIAKEHPYENDSEDNNNGVTKTDTPSSVGIYVIDPKIVDDTEIYGNAEVLSQSLPSKFSQLKAKVSEQKQGISSQTLPPNLCPGIYVKGAKVAADDENSPGDSEPKLQQRHGTENTPPQPCPRVRLHPDVGVYVTNAYHTDLHDRGNIYSRALSHEPTTDYHNDALDSDMDSYPRFSSLPPKLTTTATCLQCQKPLQPKSVKSGVRFCTACAGVYVLDAKHVEPHKDVPMTNKQVQPKTVYNTTPGCILHTGSESSIAEKAKTSVKPKPKPRRRRLSEQALYQNSESLDEVTSFTQQACPAPPCPTLVQISVNFSSIP